MAVLVVVGTGFATMTQEEGVTVTSGDVNGHFTDHQVVEGESFNFGVDVTCLNIYDGNRPKIGGVIRTSNDPTIPLIGFGDEAANEAFCNSPNLPRFGP